MNGTTNVQTLINQFELMAQANAAFAVPHTWSATRITTTAMPTQPKPDRLLLKDIVNRFNTQRARTQSEPVQMTPKTDEEAVEEEKKVAGAKPTTPTTFVVYKSLTVDTSQSDDEDDTATISSYEDDSDADSTTPKSHCHSTVSRSPSSYSTASTSSLDSLLSSLDIFLPELLQASGETSAEISTVFRSSLPKLAPPMLGRHASIVGRPSSTTTKDLSIPALKSRRPSFYATNNPHPAPRRSSHSATAVKSTRRFSESTRGAPREVTSHNSTSVPRYMDYDSSPRFAATKAMNMERRRQLEERSRNLAADKAKHVSSKGTRRPRTLKWQGRLDPVRSRLFDSKEDRNQLASRRHLTSSYSCG